MLLYMYAVCTAVIPMMKRVGSKVALLDCLRSGHAPVVRREFEKEGIELFSSAVLGTT